MYALVLKKGQLFNKPRRTIVMKRKNSSVKAEEHDRLDRNVEL